ncbi:hypothetical protein, partial [Roseibium sp. RKSG952]|uniref:hypothetical protein n=1 Tax=Roseibium sp. RKSG952 TaxID=2529384 RepID=UPI0012BBF8A2
MIPGNCKGCKQEIKPSRKRNKTYVLQSPVLLTAIILEIEKSGFKSNPDNIVEISPKKEIVRDVKFNEYLYNYSNYSAIKDNQVEYKNHNQEKINGIYLVNISDEVINEEGLLFSDVGSDVIYTRSSFDDPNSRYSQNENIIQSDSGNRGTSFATENNNNGSSDEVGQATVNTENLFQVTEENSVDAPVAGAGIT